MEKHRDVYVVKRSAMSSMSPCEGNAAYDRVFGNKHGCAQPRPMSPEEVFGRRLGAGTIIAVTYEILEEVPVSDDCINPWAHHRQHEKVT